MEIEEIKEITRQAKRKQELEATCRGKLDKEIRDQAKHGESYIWRQVGYNDFTDEECKYLTDNGLTVQIEAMSLFNSELDDSVSRACQVVRW